LFDEFHERSLDGDLSLALCLYLKNGLRDDLRLLPMSATLDGAAIASLIGADIIESQGRQHPVEIDYTEIRPRETLETALLNVIRRRDPPSRFR